ncbi:MAG: PH domain-containing protein [Propioniciclava sp.]
MVLSGGAIAFHQVWPLYKSQLCIQSGKEGTKFAPSHLTRLGFIGLAISGLIWGLDSTLAYFRIFTGISSWAAIAVGIASVPLLRYVWPYWNLTLHVRLDRAGILARGGSQPTLQIPWSQVEGVELRAGSRVTLHTDKQGPRPLAVGLLRSDPSLVAALIEFYRDHPRLREELHDDRVIARLRATGIA